MIKKTGERTYTLISFSSSGSYPVTAKIKGFEEIGSETVISFKNENGVEEKRIVDFVPNANVNIMDFGRQKMINSTLSEEDLKYINNKEKDLIVFSFRDDYSRLNTNNSNQATTVGAYSLNFAVNPYPNENKKLEIIKIDGETTVNKVPVKGQYIKTGAKIINLINETIYDSEGTEFLINDYDRITSEVYLPDGTVVDPSQAKAILITSANKDNILKELKKDDKKATLNEGDIVFKLPQGALQDPNSIFHNDKFRGIQNLSARFFARPRTKDEFEAIAHDNWNYNAQGAKYTDTGAGTTTIKYNGQDVIIANQGIARYDHYNLLGEITIQLDDTKYYDQTFNRIQNKGDTAYSNVLTPGQSITLEINSNSDNDKGPSKSYDDMKKAKVNGLVNGTIIEQFKEMAEKNGWTIKTEKDNPSEFTVTAPKTARPGDTMYLPIEYTYTNGSVDTHAFYFVVKDNNNIKPEYNAESGFQGDTLKITPAYTPSTKDDLNNPESYELIPGKYTDDRGNVWSNVSIDSKTGVVTAVVPTGENINIIGGENIFIPVKVNYTDKLTGKKKSETVKAQFIARPKYQNEVVHEYEKDIPFETKEELEPNLEAGKFQVVNQGTVGKKKFKFTQAIQNGVKGIINAEGKFEAGDDKYVLAEETVTEKVDRLVKVGVKPVEESVTIPHTIEYVVDPSLKPGEEVVEQPGSDGEITIKTVRDPQTGAIKTEKSTKYDMQPMRVRIGAYDHKNKEPFETKIEFDDNLPAGTTETKTEGVVGETETKVTPAKIADMDDMYTTIGEENFRDDNNNPNYDAIEKYMVEKGYWIPGKVQKTTDQDGKITATYNGDNIDDLLGMDEKNNPVGKVLVKGRVETNEITKKRDKVIKVGTMTEGKHSHTEEIPFGYTVEYDENMDAGTYEIVTAGKAGSRTTEWTIKNSQVVGKPTVTETEQINAVIKVGKKPVESMCPVIPPKGGDSEGSGKDKPSTPDNPKPGTDTPDKPNPGKPENPDKPNPNKPVNPDKENPGTEQPDSPKPEKPDSPKPGTDIPEKPINPNPEKPINPSPEKPKVPEESTPNKVEEIGPKDSENKNPALVENKENSEVEKVEEAKAKNEDSKEVETKKEDSENSPKYKDLKTNAMQGNKVKSLADNPKTYDAGIGGYAAITGLASSLLAAFEMKRRKKH